MSRILFWCLVNTQRVTSDEIFLRMCTQWDEQILYCSNVELSMKVNVAIGYEHVFSLLPYFFSCCLLWQAYLQSSALGQSMARPHHECNSVSFSLCINF